MTNIPYNLESLNYQLIFIEYYFFFYDTVPGGVGYILGLDDTAPAAASVQMRSEVSTEIAIDLPGLNDEQDITRLQVVLHDGRSIKINANCSQYVGTLRNYLMAHYTGGRQCKLLVGQPPQPILEDNATLEQCNLLRSTITQCF